MIADSEDNKRLSVTKPVEVEHDVQDMSEILQELRILLQGAQVLTAFLVILPFNSVFNQIVELEKWIYVTTFLCSLTALVLLTAPAAQHRLARPLVDRVSFKEFATRMIIAGVAFTSLALVLATQLVVSQVVGDAASLVVAGVVAVLIAVVWWVLPLAHKKEKQEPD